MPMFCPEPKSAEQCRSMVNQVVGRVHNEVMGGVRRRGLNMRPDVLLRQFSELGEGAHNSGISHRARSGDHHAFVMRSPVMLSPACLSTFIGAALALPANAIAIASALSGDGSPRLRMSSFDSILMRPRESMPHLIEPSPPPHARGRVLNRHGGRNRLSIWRS